MGIASDLTFHMNCEIEMAIYRFTTKFPMVMGQCMVFCGRN